MSGPNVTRAKIETAAHMSHPGLMGPLTIEEWSAALAFYEHVIRLRDGNAYRGKQKQRKAFRRAMRACSAYGRTLRQRSDQ